MKNLKLTIPRIISLILLGSLLTSIESLIGEIPTPKTDAYTVWELLWFLIMLTGIWLIGYNSKENKN